MTLRYGHSPTHQSLQPCARRQVAQPVSGRELVRQSMAKLAETVPSPAQTTWGRAPEGGTVRLDRHEQKLVSLQDALDLVPQMC